MVIAASWALQQAQNAEGQNAHMAGGGTGYVE